MLPALAHVGAARALADRMQVECAHDALQVLVALSAKKFDAQPIRPRMHLRRGHRHRWSIRDDVEGSSHWARLKPLFYAVSEFHTNTLIQLFSDEILNGFTVAAAKSG